LEVVETPGLLAPEVGVVPDVVVEVAADVVPGGVVVVDVGVGGDVVVDVAVTGDVPVEAVPAVLAELDALGAPAVGGVEDGLASPALPVSPANRGPDFALPAALGW
jgi:hypothetical protein